MASTDVSKESRMERLTNMGLTTMQRLRELRKKQVSPTRVILDSKQEILEETVTIKADGMVTSEKESVEEGTVVESGVRNEEEKDENKDEADEEASVPEDVEEEEEDEEEDIEEEEEDIEEEIEVKVVETDEEDSDKKGAEEEESNNEGVEEEESNKEENDKEDVEVTQIDQDPIYKALVSAFQSNEDLYVDQSSIPRRAQQIRDELEVYPDNVLRSAIFITHLSAGTFVGLHSYTFRKEVIVDKVYDLSRLYDKDYVWPEVYNNAMLPDSMKQAYSKIDDAEIARVRSLLEHGESLPAHQNMICYTRDNECSKLRPCKITTKSEIIVPGMQDSKPVGYCFRRDILFDILLTDQVPANPHTGEAFPKQLVDSIYSKYKGEILMRMYYLETTLGTA